MPDASDLRPGDPEEIGGYRVLSRLGAGGQGVVYLAGGANGQQVAIKQLRSVEDERARQQLVKEVAAARLVAPFCTAQVVDAQLDGPSPYVVSEYIEGPSLQQQVQRHGPITGVTLQRLAIGTATALAAIHQAGVVHRDFKPANVMLSADGPRVIDFGIARTLSADTTVTSRIFGTPAYMAPEQLRAERVGPEADMFAWASVIAYAATGRAPFEAEHIMAVVHRITVGEPSLAGVPAELIDVLEHCLDKDPAERPSAQQALAMLLGRPAPAHDLTDATRVLAEATGIVRPTAPTTPIVQRTAPAPTRQQPPPPLQQLPPTLQQPPTPPTLREPAPTPQQATPTLQQATPTRQETAPTMQPQPLAPTPHRADADQGHDPTVLQRAPAARNQPPAPPLPPPAQSGQWGEPRPRPAAPNPRRRMLLVAAGVVVLLLAVAGGLWGAGQIAANTGSTGTSATTGPSVQPSTAAGTIPAASATDDGDNNDDNDNGDDTVATDVIPENFDGTWEGTASQPTGVQTSFPVRLELEEGESSGRMYLTGGLDCSGPVTVETATSRTLVLDSVIDKNPRGRCALAGTVHLVLLTSDRITYVWQDVSNPLNIATGQLRQT